MGTAILQKRFICIIAALFCFTMAFTQGIQFHSLSEEAALTKAKAAHKKMMIAVLKPDEPFGKAMETVYKDASLSKFMNENYICIKRVLDPDNKADIDYANDMEIKSYPTYFFVNEETEEIVYTKEGRAETANDFLEIARSVVYGFCYAFQKIIKDYPNNFKNIREYKMESTAVSTSHFASAIPLLEVESQRISETYNPKTKNLVSTSFESVLADKIRTKSLGMAIMEDWRKEIMECDFAPLKASAVNYRKERVDETEMIVINFKLPASPYSNFYIVLSLSPRDLFSVDTNYKLTLSIDKK